MFSGGAGSWASAKRVAELHGTDRLKLVFTDTLIEDEDLYRFLDEAADNVGGEFIRLADGRDVWQVFFDVRFLGNSRIDPCSKILKRDLFRKWLKENYPDPETVVIYLGFDWTEDHRYQKAIPHWAPYEIKAPLCEAPYLDKDDVFEWMENEGIKRPRLYEMGFPHNNCGGFCVKAGQAHFKRLLEVMPDRYAYHENKEQEIREFLGKDVAILKQMRNKVTRPLTLKDLRLQVEAEQPIDQHDWGGCGCFSPEEGLGEEGDLYDTTDTR